ncbi:MAG: hypothetical protein HXS48_07745 [Theionarchaea archaeon]|nr:hypothetical protein [Theionarchaea archaeon]
MTIWNLEDDWLWLFSMPISDGVAEDDYTLQIEEDSGGAKRLVIDIQSSDEVDVLAMVPGRVTSNGDTMILTSDIFTLLVYIMENEMSEVHTNWFLNWDKIGRLPEKIYYENVTDGVSRTTRAGEVIGKAGDHSGDTSRKQVKIKIEYLDDTTNESKFMHPREFFSLLFWKEECDPVLNQLPLPSYHHPLLRKMMLSRENGTSEIDPGPFQDDDWLGLRPPLRTFQRVKWEAIREHLIDNYKTYWGKRDPGRNIQGNVNERIKNPLIHKEGYEKNSKCNIFSGEMLFRAGFVTTAGLFKLKETLAYPCCGNDTNGIQNKLRYIQPFSLNRHSKFCSRYVKICINTANLEEDCRCFPSDNDTHRIQLPYGTIVNRIDIDVDEINRNIENSGSVYLAVNDFHVVIVDRILESSSSGIRVCAIDQWAPELGINSNDCSGGNKWWSRSHYSHLWTAQRLIEMSPGDDPTEVWGKLNLNRLEEVPQNG